MKNFLEQFAYRENDSDEVRQEKNTAFMISFSCCIAGCFWALMYYTIFGFSIVTFLPILFVIIVGTSILTGHISGNYHITIYTEIICIIYITALIQWNIGGVFDSGLVLVWTIIGPMTALIFFSLGQSIFWFTLFAINILITAYFEPHFSAHKLPVYDNIKITFFALNMVVSSIVVFSFAYYFVSRTVKERKKSNLLLLNILPKSIAKSLKDHREVIASGHSEVSVLFADIVGFSEYSSGESPYTIVQSLHTVFNAFDEATEKRGLEKIKTIGDAYMVAAGVPEFRKDHGWCIANLALEMLEIMRHFKEQGKVPFSIRIGIHCGPVVAGVIGKSKFAYDLWGDTVNVASRMESHGTSGTIQVTAAFYNETKAYFAYEHLGSMHIKGKGNMETYRLLGLKNHEQ